MSEAKAMAKEKLTTPGPILYENVGEGESEGDEGETSKLLNIFFHPKYSAV